MEEQILRVKELSAQEVPNIASYWTDSSDQHLIGMGVDLTKLPPKEDIINFLNKQISLDIKQRNSFALVWFIDDKAVGHCNVDQISFGEKANMHLHFWKQPQRRKGLGTQLVKLSIPHFFDRLHLKQLICEPYALNEAPNKTIPKLGFEFEKEHITIPGSLCFEQKVNKWVLSRSKFIELYNQF